MLSAETARTHIVTIPDKQVKTKDLHNLRQKAEAEKTEGHPVEEQVWKTLQDMVAEDPGAHFSVFVESEKSASCIFSKLVHETAFESISRCVVY
ncbi:hypothetical protein PoB_002604000 [Plakobranchus ocellatus]|uniref:Uncharacterized protein n=1 Tax=Plakobranchus ocellatus TaxID=259542 RepID=A0AAV3ZXZ2_9GAST|nr:hypothetical protein PoB_002604000 [Plakobranchus ocellatus]